jgi:hypothetical protein
METYFRKNIVCGYGSTISSPKEIFTEEGY